MVAGKRQVTPSRVDIDSSAEQLSKLTVSGDRTKPVSSDLARERTAKLATAAALAKLTLDDAVRRAYVKLSYKDVSRISVLPLPASLNKSDGTQRLTRSVRSAMTDILMRCDDRCQEGVRAPTWVPGWIHPLRLAFNRVITPDRTTTARMTTLIDDWAGVKSVGRRSIWARGFHPLATPARDALRPGRHGGRLHQVAYFFWCV